MPDSLNHVATSPFKAATEFFKYVFFQTGILSMPINCLSLFVRSSSLHGKTVDLLPRPMNTYSNSRDKIPDIEIMALAVGSSDNMEEHERLYSKIGMFSLFGSMLQPKSRGSVRLASSNPHDFPKVDLGLLSAPEDYIVARKATRLAIKLGNTMIKQGFPLLRGVIVPESDSDKDVDEFVKKHIRSGYHYSSSCRMGLERYDDGHVGGVVDDELKVHGVQNLRICDASVFPQIPSMHLQAPVVMAAEKCADMIKSRWAA
jgi:choline dehydrogenase